jgi:predicted transcriptional regulator
MNYHLKCKPIWRIEESRESNDFTAYSVRYTLRMLAAQTDVETQRVCWLIDVCLIKTKF